MADDLGRFLRGEPIEARAASAPTRLWRAAAKRRATLIPAALGALLLAAVIVLLSGPRGESGIALDDFEATPQGWRFAAGEEFPGAQGRDGRARRGLAGRSPRRALNGRMLRWSGDR